MPQSSRQRRPDPARPGDTLVWDLPNDLAAARRIEPDIFDALHRHGFTEESVFAVRLALEEALSNAVRHGNRMETARSVRVEAVIDDRQAVIRVGDDGCGFDRAAVPDPTSKENLEKPSGRGIMLMEAYMTSVSWNPRGNCVEMVKLNE